MPNLACISFFSGGGGKTIGAMQSGFTPVCAVEYDADIAACYVQNIGNHMLCQPIQSLDMRTLPYADLCLGSPPCALFSVASNATAKAKRKKENPNEEAIGLRILDYVQAHHPKGVLIENVPAYRHSPCFQAIVCGLEAEGYWVTYDIINSADMGVPQTRRRLILRAVLNGFVPTLPCPVAWNGWYAAIKNLIPTLPESKFADWQLKRLPAYLQESVSTDSCVNTIRAKHPFRALLIENRQNSREASCRDAFAPSMSVNTDHVESHQPKSWLETGRVVSMTPRALARFQTFPDWYVLPAKAALACKIIGNAAPCLMIRILCEQLKETML